MISLSQGEAGNCDVSETTRANERNEHGNSPSSTTCKCLGAIGAGLCCEDYNLVLFGGVVQEILTAK